MASYTVWYKILGDRKQFMHKMSVAEIRILRQMLGNTKKKKSKK